jgi:hypothetical protein
MTRKKTVAKSKIRSGASLPINIFTTQSKTNIRSDTVKIQTIWKLKVILEERKLAAVNHVLER